jgi:iron(II)-dependent oxidoreductase
VAARAGAAPALDSTLVAIPGGAYLLGAADAGRAAPAHRVQLESFAIGRHEVTQGEYDAFATATGAPRPWTGAPQASYPVTGVLFAEAANYCRWRHPAGGDLPSEAQWEAAARGTAGRRFPWGDSVDVAAANVAGGGRTAPAPVGAYPRGASPEGVLDLVGNVWEWTRSPLVPYPGGAPLPDSLAQYRVIRGGAWNAPADVATPWFRGYVRPEGPRSALALTGFRCVVPAAR